jgi:hypothetical protein
VWDLFLTSSYQKSTGHYWLWIQWYVIPSPHPVFPSPSLSVALFLPPPTLPFSSSAPILILRKLFLYNLLPTILPLLIYIQMLTHHYIALSPSYLPFLFNFNFRFISIFIFLAAKSITYITYDPSVVNPIITNAYPQDGLYIVYLFPCFFSFFFSFSSPLFFLF